MRLFIDDLELGESVHVQKIRKITMELYCHPLYREIKTVEDIRLYMGFQVWCVWDFMTLLKSIQKKLLAPNISWVPLKDANLGAYLFEILLTEETDISYTGSGRCSHFETYLKAMAQIGADTSGIGSFIEMLRSGVKFRPALASSELPAAARKFTSNTLKHSNSSLHKVVSVFCLSREGIIPGMFHTMLSEIRGIEQASIFKWYLQRHIEVDSDSHGPLSIKLFKSVIGSDRDKLEQALAAAVDALKARKVFLDQILAYIKHNRI